MRRGLLLLLLGCTLCMYPACKKDKPVIVNISPPHADALYPDSVFYIDAADKNMVSPLNVVAGTYTCFPEGLNIDQNTGAFDVNSSETGLKYKISFTNGATGGVRVAYVTVSGINYKDKIFNLANGDSIAAPIYNAKTGAAIPHINNGTGFDQNSGCKDAGIEVSPIDGTINLAKTVRDQGIDTGSTQEVKLQYRINDASHEALNGLDVKVYFYRTASEIPQYLQDILTDRKTTILSAIPQGQGMFTASASSFAPLSSKPKPGRPRPPCIIVVSR